ncbi:hypothetical protein [Streptomyces sp. NPDC056194]|uniref:hypothetical protein n=1 Tax=Streptomyces sp. NPDC056194 TaxID=3345744 RepID=UPI0035D6CD27
MESLRSRIVAEARVQAPAMDWRAAAELLLMTLFEFGSDRSSVNSREGMPADPSAAGRIEIVYWLTVRRD